MSTCFSVLSFIGFLMTEWWKEKITLLIWQIMLPVKRENVSFFLVKIILFANKIRGENVKINVKL